MLKNAKLYESELRDRFLETEYDLKYMFYHGGYSDTYSSSNSTWNNSEFVSVDKNNNVIGYIAYSNIRNSERVSGLKIINFTNNKITFGKDVKQAIEDVFLKFNFRKLSFGVYIGNPIEKSYDRFIKEYGGEIVGIKEKEDRLLDGKIYDLKMYEIFREDFIRNYNKK